MLKVLLIAQAIIIVILTWAVSIVGKDEFHSSDPTEEIESSRSRMEGNLIWIDEITQQSIKLTTERPIAKEYTPKKIFPGVVVPVNSIISANEEIKLLSTKKLEMNLRYKQKKQDLTRISALFNSEKKASERQVELAQVDFEKTKQSLRELTIRSEAIRLNTQAQWTEEISRSLGTSNTLIMSIIEGKVSLVRFSVREEFDFENFSWVVELPFNYKSAVLNAEILGPAGTTEDSEPGETWLLKSPSLNLASNSPVSVVSYSKKKLVGVNIQNSAMVRYAGQTWIYVKRNKHKFERVILKSMFQTDNSIFTEEIMSNEEIVTTGAQILLSEELKHLITNENED